MGYPDFPIPEQKMSYIPGADVLSYIELYADTFKLREHIQFNHQVIRVRPIANERWECIVRDLKADQYRTETYDAVMVCNGHYSKPLIPDYEDMKLFAGRLMHSHVYRCPDSFKGEGAHNI